MSLHHELFSSLSWLQTTEREVANVFIGEFEYTIEVDKQNIATFSGRLILASGTAQLFTTKENGQLIFCFNDTFFQLDESKILQIYLQDGAVLHFQSACLVLKSEQLEQQMCEILRIIQSNTRHSSSSILLDRNLISALKRKIEADILYEESFNRNILDKHEEALKMSITNNRRKIEELISLHFSLTETQIPNLEIELQQMKDIYKQELDQILEKLN